MDYTILFLKNAAKLLLFLHICKYFTNFAADYKLGECGSIILKIIPHKKTIISI